MTRLALSWIAALTALTALIGPAAAVVPTSAEIDCAAPRGVSADAPPLTRIWTDEDGAETWAPPPCTGWTAPGYRAMVRVTGGFRFAGTTQGLLGRIGAISRLPEMRYWSVSDGEWTQLVTAATALSAPEEEAARADFAPHELTAGATVHFAQEDNRSSGAVIYRLRVLEATPDRLVLASENATEVRWLMLTLADPGALQALHVMEKVDGDLWSYSLLSRTGLGASSLVSGREQSLANRAEALFRFLAERAGEPDAPGL